MQAFRAAPGIELALFAAEPHLANPVAFTFDARGRVYVAETFRHHQGVTDIRDHMEWLDDDLAAQRVEDRRALLEARAGTDFNAGYARAFEQVRRIEDTDGDLVADADTVFASGFADPVAGIGAGLLWDRDQLYYTCIPDLWRLRDVDGDGMADERTRLSSGYGVHVALLGHDLHGLVLGPDRRLYFSCGDRGFHVETPEGVIAHPDSGAVLRCELDGSHLEVWHDGLRNPQELAFDDQGDLWTGDNNSDGGDRARWVHVVEGGDSGWRYPYQWITAPVARGPWNDEKLWWPPFEGQAAYLVPPVANLADGPSGLCAYPGTGLSAAYSGHFFLCDFRGDASTSGIHAFTVEPRGASFALGPVQRFLWGALATDCAFGPDGALWFSDWVYGWEQTGKGRLYRAFDPEAQRSALVAETRALLAAGMDGRDEDELLELLGHADRRVRQEAHFALAERGSPGRVAAVALDDRQPRLARLHALWSLWIRVRRGEGELTGALLACAERADPELRAQALRALGDVRARGAERVVLAGLAAPEARVRFFAALAAAHLALPEAVAPLRALLVEAGAQDPDLRHAAVMGLVGCASPTEVERLAEDPDRSVRLGALLVERRRCEARGGASFAPPSGEARRRAELGIARFLLDPDPALVLESARAIHDVPIPFALESLARARIDAAVLALGERAFVRRVLSANERLGNAAALADLAEREDLAPESRVLALERLAHWSEPSGRDLVTNAWRPRAGHDPAALPALALRLASTLAHAPDDVLEATVRFAGVAGAPEVAAVLARLVGDPRRGSAVKAAALEALEALGAPDLVAIVRTALADADGGVRAAALERLERIAPAEALAGALEVVEAGEIAERRAAYRILAAHPEPAAASALADELARLAHEGLPAELALDLVEASARQGAPALREALAARAAARVLEPAQAPYLDALFGGDAERGSAVFQRVDLACTRCHAWWPDAAPRVGPNLHGVGRRLTRLQLLEAIVAPNRRTTPGYGTRAFFLSDGRVVSGRVVEEGADLVRLFDSANNPIALERAAIAEERVDVSAMPEGLAKGLAPGEMRDLLEYLGTL